MNEINASKRLKESAYQRAEGEKILKVRSCILSHPCLQFP
jgi:hypothetical protein